MDPMRVSSGVACLIERFGTQTALLKHWGHSKIDPIYAREMAGTLKATGHGHIYNRHFCLQQQMTGAIQPHFQKVLLWGRIEVFAEQSFKLACGNANLTRNDGG